VIGMKQLPKPAILPVLKAELEQRLEILFAYVFGSFTEEETFRDLDVGVFVRDEQVLQDWLTYIIRRSLALERATGYEVDVVLMNKAPDHLIHSVSKGEVLVDRDEDFRTDWILRSWKRYLDIQPKCRQALIDMFT